MKYGDRDLYREWKNNPSDEEYSEYIKREAIAITDQILKKYSFLLQMGYKEIKNIDNHVVRFERMQNNCKFSIFYPSMNSMELHVYYEDLPIKLTFNGDGEYDECISIFSDAIINMDKRSVEMAEIELMTVFNENLEKLRIIR